MIRRFVLGRLFEAVPTLLGVAVVVFVLVRVVPGNPIALMVPPGASAADIENLRALYGFDRTLLDQFLIWSAGLAHGNFGVSISLRQDVLELVMSRLPATLELAAFAALIAIALGTVLAVASTAMRGTLVEAVIDGVTGVALSVPDFIWALIFILLLGVFLPVLPISGRSDPTIAYRFFTQFHFIESLVRLDVRAVRDHASHLILPALSLGLPFAAMITRVLRASLAEELTQDYVLIAHVKGFGRWRIILREALRNAAIPAVSLTGVQLTFLIGGTVLIEKMFSYPGIGNLAIDAVINRDLPLLQGLILTFAALFIVINIGLDLAYGALNPKIRRG